MTTECIKPHCTKPTYVGCHCRTHFFDVVKAEWAAYWRRLDG